MYNQRGQVVDGPIPESPSVDIPKRAGGKLYKNPLDCLIQTVRAEGPLAVYKVSIQRSSLTVGIFRAFVADCSSYHFVCLLN